MDMDVSCSRFKFTGTRSNRVLFRCDSGNIGAGATIALPGLAIDLRHDAQLADRGVVTKSSCSL